MNIILSKTFLYFFIIINVIGILISAINAYLTKRHSSVSLNIVLCIIAVLCGAPGILLAIIIFDAKPRKENMLTRLLIICIFIIELLAFLVFVNTGPGSVNLNFLKFFSEHMWLVYYLGIINIITFVIFGIDKARAVKEKRRIRIVTLLGLCFIGGSAGGLISMYLFRHKTRVSYFVIGIPLIIFTHICLLFYIMNIA